jgi:hypothetical protein
VTKSGSIYFYRNLYFSRTMCIYICKYVHVFILPHYMSYILFK